MPTNAKIVAVLTAKPDKVEDLKALLAGMVAPSRAEPGNLRWDVWRDQADPARFVLDELYVDSAAVAAHRETPHFKNYVSKVGALAERSAFVLDPVQVA
ncbi:antibiotic biosynthesis monooxygenase [Chelatococcus sambhunathii]|uniref:Antibiotic biosynthesis monooxygenase n=1 Tax=Chelatococcus sambhunathii TaxID=363953 RepID=A0ABU1DFE9_9HYPH|nr:putative quinol monooxygenase [Chelatococcus sambhunathii]MDR4306635.1 antibiotic biosynthesis monooxygenase [Chelatococcus sambhunathii]